MLTSDPEFNRITTCVPPPLGLVAPTLGEFPLDDARGMGDIGDVCRDLPPGMCGGAGDLGRSRFTGIDVDRTSLGSPDAEWLRDD